MLFTIAVVALLAAVPAFAIPPEDFGFPSAPNDTELGVTFSAGAANSVRISEAELIGPEVPAQPPQVSVNASAYRSIAEYTGSYLVLMVDPDASTPQQPTRRFILHWMGGNFTADPSTGVFFNSTPAVVDYARPMPPPTSDPHRYILYAFQQPAAFAVPEAFSGFSAQNRTNFNLTSFISAAMLMDPAAANYYFVQNKTGTPPDFTASAGGEYPGGNGMAVTQGPGPSITPSPSDSGSGSMTTMSGMGSEMTGATEPVATATDVQATTVPTGGAAMATAAPKMGGAALAAVGGLALYAL